MKTTLTLLVAAAAVAVAQDVGSLPACGVSLLPTPQFRVFALVLMGLLQQTCVSNMINIASTELGCTAGDVACYCTNQDFGFGIRDCSSAICSPEEAASVIAFGAEYCASTFGPFSSVLPGQVLLTRSIRRRPVRRNLYRIGLDRPHLGAIDRHRDRR